MTDLRAKAEEIAYKHGTSTLSESPAFGLRVLAFECMRAALEAVLDLKQAEPVPVIYPADVRRLLASVEDPKEGADD